MTWLEVTVQARDGVRKVDKATTVLAKGFGKETIVGAQKSSDSGKATYTEQTEINLPSAGEIWLGMSLKFKDAHQEYAAQTSYPLKCDE